MKEEEIVLLLKEKASVKQDIYRKTKIIFNNLQDVLITKSNKLNALMKKHDKSVKVTCSSTSAGDAPSNFVLMLTISKLTTGKTSCGKLCQDKIPIINIMIRLKLTNKGFLSEKLIGIMNN